MAKYRLKSRSFIAPNTYEAGQVLILPDDFIPSMHMEPLDASAEAMVAKQRKLRPHAFVDPIEALPIVPVQALVVEDEPEPILGSEDRPIGLAEALSVKAKPGLTEGGKVAGR